MSVERIAVNDDGTLSLVCLSTDTKPAASSVPVGSRILELNTGIEYLAGNGAWNYINKAHDLFTPANMNSALTMDGTAQFEALDSSSTKVRLINSGATTEAILVAFGDSESEAEDNLTIVSNVATTGTRIEPHADGESTIVLPIPRNALGGVMAACNAALNDTPILYVEQGR